MAFEFKLNTTNQLRKTLSQKRQREIANVYQEVSADVKRQAEKLKGQTNISTLLKRQYLNQLAQEANKAIKATQSKLKDGITNDMAAISESVAKENDAFMKRVGLPTGAKLLHIPTEVVESVVTGRIYKGKWSLSGALWQDVARTQSDINNIVAKGIAVNKSAYEIAKDLESYVSPNARKDWEWSKVYPNTKLKIDYNAQRLARTLVSHAYQQSTVEFAKANPFTQGIKWQSALIHGRTCQLCRERNGQIYKPNKIELDHPNGLCTFITVMDDLDDVGTRLAAWTKGKEDKALDKYVKWLEKT